MIPYKPHTFILGDRHRVLDGKVVVTWANSSPTIEIPCQITPDAQGRAFTDFGVESSNPYMLLTDPEWEPVLLMGRIGSFGGKVWILKVDAKLWNAEPLTASTETVIELLK